MSTITRSSPATTVALLAAAQAGSNAATEQLLYENQGLVHSQVKRYVSDLHDYDDLWQEGRLGLLRAIRGFRADKGCLFSTYAIPWIRQGISRYVRERTAPIRLPAHVVDKLSLLKRAQQQLQQERDAEPALEELVAATQLSRETVRMLQHLPVVTDSLDVLIGSDEDEPLISIICGGADTEAEIEQRDLADCIQAALVQLSDEERRTITQRYGLDGQGSMSLAEVAECEGISRQGVAARERNALRRLRAVLDREREMLVGGETR